MSNNIYADEHGLKIEILRTDETGVSYCQQGGGFVHLMTRERFETEFKPFTFPLFSLRNVSAEFVDNAELDAYSDGFAWNGWATPYFTLEQGLKLCEKMPSVRYDAGSDAFIATDEHQDPEDREQPFEATEIQTAEGPLKVYGIGAGFWVWEWADEVEEPPAG